MRRNDFRACRRIVRPAGFIKALLAAERWEPPSQGRCTAELDTICRCWYKNSGAIGTYDRLLIVTGLIASADRRRP